MGDSPARLTTARARLQLPSDGGAVECDLSEAVRADAPGPEDRVSRDEVLAERREALAGLKPDERKALWLLGFGLSYAEICEVTGWTYTKVNRCLAEGRSALRKAQRFRY